MKFVFVAKYSEIQSTPFKEAYMCVFMCVYDKRLLFAEETLYSRLRAHSNAGESELDRLFDPGKISLIPLENYVQTKREIARSAPERFRARNRARSLADGLIAISAHNGKEV